MSVILKCPICQSKIESDAPKILHSPSNKTSETVDHIFHKACLSDWLRLNSTCPTCREPMPISTKIRILKTYDTGIVIVKYVLVFTLQIFAGMVITFIARIVTKNASRHTFGSIEVGSLAIISGIAVIASAKKIARIVGKDIDMSPEILGTIATTIVSLSNSHKGILNFIGTLAGAIAFNHSAGAVSTLTRRARLVEVTAIGSATVNMMILLKLNQTGIALACISAIQLALMILYVASD